MSAGRCPRLRRVEDGAIEAIRRSGIRERDRGNSSAAPRPTSSPPRTRAGVPRSHLLVYTMPVSRSRRPHSSAPRIAATSPGINRRRWALVESERLFRDLFYYAPTAYHELTRGRITCVQYESCRCSASAPEEKDGHYVLGIHRRGRDLPPDLGEKLADEQRLGRDRARLPGQGRTFMP